MPTINEAVDFLRENHALCAPEQSPWRTLEEDEQAYQMDWDRLWSDQWECPFSFEDEQETQEALEGGPPPDSLMPSECYENGAHWDRCAWYQPIHFFGNRWGIFIKESCVRRTALMIARFVPPWIAARPNVAPLRDLYRAAVLVYFLHEHYHHKIECLGFRLHVVLRNSCYLPYDAAVYRATLGTDNNLEEALANADAYLRLSQNPYNKRLPDYIRFATKDYLEWEFRNCSPPGYRMAVNYLTEADFNAGENFLQAQVREGSVTPGQPVNEWDLCPRMAHPFFNVKSNIWTVVPSGGVKRLPISPAAFPTSPQQPSP